DLFGTHQSQFNAALPDHDTGAAAGSLPALRTLCDGRRRRCVTPLCLGHGFAVFFWSISSENGICLAIPNAVIGTRLPYCCRLSVSKRASQSIRFPLPTSVQTAFDYSLLIWWKREVAASPHALNGWRPSNHWHRPSRFLDQSI